MVSHPSKHIFELILSNPAAYIVHAKRMNDTAFVEICYGHTCICTNSDVRMIIVNYHEIADI